MEVPTSLLLCAFCRSMLRVRCGRCLKCNLEQAHQVKIQPASGDHRYVYEIFRWQNLYWACMGRQVADKVWPVGEREAVSAAAVLHCMTNLML